MLLYFLHLLLLLLLANISIITTNVIAASSNTNHAIEVTSSGDTRQFIATALADGISNEHLLRTEEDGFLETQQNLNHEARGVSVPSSSERRTTTRAAKPSSFSQKTIMEGTQSQTTLQQSESARGDTIFDELDHNTEEHSKSPEKILKDTFVTGDVFRQFEKTGHVGAQDFQSIFTTGKGHFSFKTFKSHP